MTIIGLIFVIVILAVVIGGYPYVFGKEMPEVLKRLLYLIGIIVVLVWLLSILGVTVPALHR